MLEHLDLVFSPAAQTTQSLLEAHLRALCVASAAVGVQYFFAALLWPPSKLRQAFEDGRLDFNLLVAAASMQLGWIAVRISNYLEFPEKPIESSSEELFYVSVGLTLLGFTFKVSDNLFREIQKNQGLESGQHSVTIPAPPGWNTSIYYAWITLTLSAAL
jgi:hypothetical protein